jgi:hypothetical protein
MGLKWKPLKESTEIYKPLRRGEVSPTIRRKIRERKGTKKELLAGRKTSINIRTGRLEKSLRPGRVISGRYVNDNKDQQVAITPTGINFNINVEYADDVQLVRPFLPENTDLWFSDAIQKALPKLRIELRKQGLL